MEYTVDADIPFVTGLLFLPIAAARDMPSCAVVVLRHDREHGTEVRSVAVGDSVKGVELAAD